jgi:two-component system NtrC family sensor kinase
VEEVTIEGRRYLRAVSWLSETNWALVVRVPRDRAYAPLAQARWLLSGIALAALALILVVVLRSTRKLVARLESADAAKDSLRQHLFNAAKLASVGEMATGVAHEINNPLAIIYEEAAMLQDLLDPRFGRSLEPEELRERLEAIIEATMRGRAITGKLLAFARRHDPDPEPSDINVLLDRVIEVKRVDFSVSDIEVVRDFQPDLPPVMLNRNQIDQVMLNLLNNAKDAIGDGGTITLRTRRDDGMVRIDVTDDGAGMPPEVLEQVFFPFFTTKAVGRGTGLGLSISHGIIESHGGRIAVRSQVGRGTTFSVFLPLDPKQAAEPPAEDDEAPIAG